MAKGPFLVLLTLAAWLAAPAFAQPATVAGDDEPPLPASVGTADPCKSVRPDEITVCGQRDQADRYRIDPGVLGAGRQANANPKPEQKLAPKEDCPPHGPVCSGQGAVPIGAIAIVAVKSAVLAAKGEDWKAPLRVGTNDYDEYRAAKAKEERRRKDRRVRIGVGATGDR